MIIDIYFRLQCSRQCAITQSEIKVIAQYIIYKMILLTIAMVIEQCSKNILNK